jgi:hypothetical protein
VLEVVDRSVDAGGELDVPLEAGARVVGVVAGAGVGLGVAV